MTRRLVREIVEGRVSAKVTPGTVVFLIGMRINRFTDVRSWLPVFRAMGPMLKELLKNPDLGLLSAKSFMSGRVVMLVQYWRDIDSLNAYASNRDASHLPAWQQFNKAARKSKSVGIFHESYVIADYETVAVNMPSNFGLAGATLQLPTVERGDTARDRLSKSKE